MIKIKEFARRWINQNVFDGDDRSEAENDSLAFSAPEFYELMDDLADALEEEAKRRLTNVTNT